MRLATAGLARSRNAALDSARGAILFFADDDVVHPPSAPEGIRRFFAENPGLDLFVGRSLDPDGRPRKRPLPRRRLTRLNAARASSHEIAVRLAPVRAAGIRFDEGFGIGAGTAATLGEEYVFLADCLAAGLWECMIPCRLACIRTRAQASSGKAKRRHAPGPWFSLGSSAMPRRRCGSPSR